MASSIEQRYAPDLARADALARLVEERLPMEFEDRGDADAWPMVATALLSRAATTLRHVFDAGPGGRQAVDAATLGRSLFEHVVHFAWLGADPSAERLQAWRRVDLVARRTADNDTRTVGVELFTDTQRAALEDQIAGLNGPDRLNLADLAVAADKHWAGRLPGLYDHTDTSSFRGLYAVLYRSYSPTAHPTMQGLNPVVEDVSPTRRRVVIEKPAIEDRGPFGMATVVFALGLFIAAATLGWPDLARVNAAFADYPTLS